MFDMQADIARDLGRRFLSRDDRQFELLAQRQARTIIVAQAERLGDIEHAPARTARPKSRAWTSNLRARTSFSASSKLIPVWQSFEIVSWTVSAETAAPC
ncbi:hypothetical protein [Aureimonas endophytica]|uniref:hypothetical protein n=1 Tax=Aureimonas endophytica TaxID=2027858 RepID=UPI001AEE4410|nr:hypothetical protein [Aureimonas endophytica]